MRTFMILLLMLYAVPVFAGSAMPPKASQIPNDSNVSGTTVKDAVQTISSNGVPVRTHIVVHLASTTGCAAGWQTTLSSEITILNAAGISSDYILCVDVSQ